MSEQHQAVFMGASVMDLIAYCDRFPEPGETVNGNEFRKGTGGKSANACVMSSRLGLKCAMLAKIGDDDFGREMLANFAQQGINADHILQTKEIFTSTASICVSKDGQNSIVYVPGPSNLLTSAEVSKLSDSLFKSDQVKLFVSTFECLPETLLTALKIAKQKNVKTLVNAAPAFISNFSEEIYSFIDIMCLNESEASHMTSIKIKDRGESAKKAMIYLLDKGCKSVLLTLGSDGVLYLDGASGNDNPIHIPAVKVKPVDTTGAGDAFMGSLAYYLVCHPHLDMKQMCSRACQIATVSVAKQGTQSSYPWKKELPVELFQ